MVDEVFTTIGTTLTERIAALDAATDAERLRADKAEKLAHFGPDGMWRFAPDSEKRKSEAAVDAEHAAIAGRALFDVQDAILHAEPELDAARAAAMHAPDAETAWRLRTRQIGLTAAESLQVRLLDEMVSSRVAGALTGAMPSAVLRTYSEALTDPTDPTHAATIRYVERTFSGHWPGTDVKASTAEVTALRTLTALIASTREARIPEAAVTAQQALAAARGAAQFATEVRRVVPVRTRDPHRS